jgi:hypothetical protein
MLGIELLFMGDGDDPHCLGFFEHGKRIGNRSRRRAAEIPRNGNGAEFERRGRFGQDKGRPARSEYHCFCIPLVIAFRHGHDREVAKPGVFSQQIRCSEGRAFL